MAVASSAYAQKTPKEEKGKFTPSPSAGPQSEPSLADSEALNISERNRGHLSGEGAEEGKEERSIKLNVDFVLGFGSHVDVVNQTFPPSFGPVQSASIDSAKVTTYSFIAGAGYELAKGFELGARLPFGWGSIQSNENRGTGVVGNLEVEGAYEYELNERMELEFALGIALPTAQGTETPDSPDAVPVVAGAVNTAEFDRFAVQKATAGARGYEDNALYEPDHVGFIPSAKLEYHDAEHKWHVDPWLKIENLIATKSGLAHGYTGELVLGVNGGYRAAEHFEPTLRLWTNVPMAGADFTAVAVAEPQLRFPFADFTPALGVILPFAGPLTSPYNVGVRFSFGARF
jgi:hypothetical protein